MSCHAATRVTTCTHTEPTHGTHTLTQPLPHHVCIHNMSLTPAPTCIQTAPQDTCHTLAHKMSRVMSHMSLTPSLHMVHTHSHNLCRTMYAYTTCHTPCTRMQSAQFECQMPGICTNCVRIFGLTSIPVEELGMSHMVGLRNLACRMCTLPIQVREMSHFMPCMSCTLGVMALGMQMSHFVSHSMFPVFVPSVFCILSPTMTTFGQLCRVRSMSCQITCQISHTLCTHFAHL